MLSDDEFRVWAYRLGISPEAQTRIEDIRSNEPARNVYGGRKNVSGIYPSKKMGVTIQFESHRVELARIYQLEYDPDVLEYYDQPYGSVELVYKSKKGRPGRTPSTPDFFVIRKDSAGWEECKPEAKLIELAEKQPNRYYRDEAGTWRCPPGEEYADRFKLDYIVWSDAEVSWEFVDNTRFLEDYWRYDYPEINPLIVASVQQLVENQRGISLADLLAADTGATSDDIYALIASQTIYVDLYRVRFSNPHDVRVFQNRDVAVAYGQALELNEPLKPEGFQKVTISIGVRLDWNGRIWEVINTGSTETSLRPTDGPIMQISNGQLDTLIAAGKISSVQLNTTRDDRQDAIKEILSQASPQDMEKARQRYEEIQPYLGELSPTCPNKRIKRWRDRYLSAKKKYGNGFVGLLPKDRHKGNRIPKIASEIQEYMIVYIQQHYETIKQRNAYSVYRSFKLQLEEDHPGWMAPSHVSFNKAIKKRSGPKQTLRRKGKRAAIQEEPMHWELTLKTPRHGSRPFEIVHIDHTPMDVELVASLEALSQCSRVVDSLTKPQQIASQAWLSVMIDAFSRKILVIYVSYESPSYRTCMMVMRICVSRFNRLPQTIVVDNGSDFHSNYFSQLAAFYEIELKYRPPAYAKFGTVVERLFDTANKQLFYNLIGNTQARKNRQTTKTVDPRRNAIWNLPDLYKELCKLFYEIYDNTTHQTLDQTPNEAYINGLAVGGTREHRRIEYDETFKIMTLPAPTGETRKVDSCSGIKMFNIRYWSDHFRDPDLEQKEFCNVEVRYDPFNIGIAYAFVKKRWVKCTSSFYQVLNGRTEKEIQLASEEIRKRKKANGKKAEVTDRELAEFLKSIEEQESLLKEHRKAIDNKSILTVIDGGRHEKRSEFECEVLEVPSLWVLPELEEPKALNMRVIESEPDEEEFEDYGEY